MVECTVEGSPSPRGPRKGQNSSTDSSGVGTRGLEPSVAIRWEDRLGATGGINGGMDGGDIDASRHLKTVELDGLSVDLPDVRVGGPPHQGVDVGDRGAVGEHDQDRCRA